MRVGKLLAKLSARWVKGRATTVKSVSLEQLHSTRRRVAMLTRLRKLACLLENAAPSRKTHCPCHTFKKGNSDSQSMAHAHGGKSSWDLACHTDSVMHVCRTGHACLPVVELRTTHCYTRRGQMASNGLRVFISTESPYSRTGHFGTMSQKACEGHKTHTIKEK